MGPVSAISIYLIIWWTVFMGVLPWGNVSFHEAGVKPPPGCDPGAPMQANMKKKLIITSAISIAAFGIFWLVVTFHLITLPDMARTY